MTLASGSLLANVDTFAFHYKVKYSPNEAPGEFYGTLTGTQVGGYTSGYVNVLSVLTLFTANFDANGDLLLDGNGDPIPASQITGPFFTHSGNADGSLNADGSAVVAYQLDQNNFFFVNGDYVNGDPFTGFAYLLNGSGVFGAYGYLNDPNDPDYPVHVVSTFDGGDGEWSLTNLTTPPPVPESGATVGLLGLALAGFAVVRRKVAAR